MATEAYSIVVFHDRGVGREKRHYHEGKIILHGNPDQEMLDEDLCAYVERDIAEGKQEGVTNNPCYPEWYLTTMQINSH